MTTLEESLDELLAMARECGTARTELTYLETEMAVSSTQTLHGRHVRRILPMARTRSTNAETALLRARERFLERMKEP